MNQQPGCLCAAGLFSFLCMGILMPALFKPSPWGPTPLIKGRCREATEGIGKVAGRKARRMRGHFKERASLEKSRRAGACPRRPWVFLFRKSTLVRIFCRGGPMWPPARGDFFFGRARRLGAPFLEVFEEGFRRLAGGELLSGCPERSQRGTRGPLRMGAHAPIFAPPWTPFTGDPPEKFPDTSGAQNLSDVPQFNPGPLGP